MVRPSNVMGKRGPERRYNVRLDIVMPVDQKARLFKAAKQQGKTVSQYIRELVEQALSNEHAHSKTD